MYEAVKAVDSLSGENEKVTIYVSRQRKRRQRKEARYDRQANRQ